MSNYNQSKVVQFYHRARSVLEYWHRGNKVYTTRAYGGYVKKGLVFQLDCTQVNDDGSSIKDLIRGVVLNGGVVKEDDGSISLIEAVNENATIPIKTSGAWTIELYSRQSLGYLDVQLSIAVPNGNGISLFGFTGSSAGYYQLQDFDDVFDLYADCDPNKLTSFSGCNYEGGKYYVNNTSYTKTKYDTSPSLCSGIRIETLDHLYSIRIYNRVLTNEEREYNAEIDNVRFNSAYGGYVKDGLIFQLDCARSLVGTSWTDLIGGKVATLTSCTIDDGVILSSGSSVTLPTIEGAEYWEVTTLNATTEEAQTTTSTTSPSPYSTAGTLYAIRAYSRTLNATEKAKNAAIDKARFGYPSTAIWLQGGTDAVCLQGGDFICLSSN